MYKFTYILGLSGRPAANCTAGRFQMPRSTAVMINDIIQKERMRRKLNSFPGTNLFSMLEKK